MSDELAPPSPIKFTWLVGILAAFSIFALIAYYSSVMTSNYPDYNQQRAADRVATLAKVRADEQALLEAPAGWVDQSKGVIHIPIEEAMVKEIDLLKNKPMAACEIPIVGLPAAPAPPVVTAPATNAPPAKPAPPAKTHP
jgi:hypothetical protein